MLRASDLQPTKRKSAIIHKEIYKKFLTSCYKQIKHKNSVGMSYTYYTIPAISLGTSLYNVDHVMTYLIKKLNEGGFVVRRVSINKVCIEWGHARSYPKNNKTK